MASNLAYWVWGAGGRQQSMLGGPPGDPDESPLHLGNEQNRMPAYCDSHELSPGFGEALGILTSLLETFSGDSRQTHIPFADLCISL